ncbi:EF-hand domain-containing family member C2-like [Anthonomus grandis grandis]|uniref:EF-hand domain-containing family member C2-like n=1 Tax=Anthonomus grandis grandis TaxID=2921223 RepID=UPI002164FEAB|nr:EF-hand domain-containing family member C2-like [Anthonomus grandis grandis]
MSFRCPELPFLPGYSFDPNIGKTNFHLNPIFGFIGKGNRALIEKVKPNMFGPLSDKFPSIYPRGQSVELPGWIMFDKQILCFDAFFQETLQEVRGSPFQVRNVKIYYFLEDGTIQVVEPKVENSGVDQGTLISRQRIRLPAPMDDNFYDMVDFNIGREVEFYARVFKIVNCDKFTRTFLNRCGISVPDPIVTPADPYTELRFHDKDSIQPKKPNRMKDELGKFLENDRKVLHFKAYWDDQNTEYGYLHLLELRYYLADDTIEIKELQSDSGGEPGFLFLRRGKLPKRYKELPSVGSNSNYTVLNVLGSALSNRRYLVDPLDCGRENIEYYGEKDLSIGAVINCYGRKLVLTECDAFTKEYYATKYGISEFTPVEVPTKNKTTTLIAKPSERELPPWNGFGTYEDSAQNCITVEPKAPIKDFKKFLLYDRVGLDSHVLRFTAKMISKTPENCTRNFIISYNLTDDTIAVFEVAQRNSGFTTSCFAARSAVQLPGQKIFTSKPPLTYTIQHMFIGATLIINGFEFVLVDADEYALRYMELNCGQFPKANIQRIMDKVREKLRPIYKDFVAENIPHESSVISYEKLRAKLCKIMGDDFTEHEMITIARAFSASCYKERYDRQKIRAIALTELKRFLWDDLERLREYFLQTDHSKTGKLTKKECYTVLKGARLPFDNELLEKILEVMQKYEDCKISYDEILQFLDRNICPPPDQPPINVKNDLWWGSEPRPEAGRLIDWCAFNKYLNLESTFRDTNEPDSIKALEMKNPQ